MPTTDLALYELARELKTPTPTVATDIADIASRGFFERIEVHMVNKNVITIQPTDTVRYDGFILDVKTVSSRYLVNPQNIAYAEVL